MAIWSTKALTGLRKNIHRLNTISTAVNKRFGGVKVVHSFFFKLQISFYILRLLFTVVLSHLASVLRVYMGTQPWGSSSSCVTTCYRTNQEKMQQ